MEVSQLGLARMLISCVLGGFLLGFLYDILRLTHFLMGTQRPILAERLQKRLALPAAIRLLPPRKRSSKKHLPTWLSAILIGMEDTLFCVICTITLILILYATNDGQFRFSAPIVLLASMLLYLKTMGKLILTFSGVILTVIRAIWIWTIALITYLPLRLLLFVYQKSKPWRDRLKLYHLMRKKRREEKKLQKRKENIHSSSEKEPEIFHHRPPDGRNSFCFGKTRREH